MFLCGDFLMFAFQALKGADDTETRVARLDDVFDITFLCGLVGVAEQVVVLLLLLLAQLCGFYWIGLGLYLLAIDDFHGAVCSHNREVG